MNTAINTVAGGRRAGLVLVCLAAAALACSLGGQPAPTLPVPVKWQQSVTTSYISVPILVEGLLIYQGVSSDSAQDVFGRDAATGELRWTFDLAANTTVDEPLPTDGTLVYVEDFVQEGGSLNVNYLFALDARSGNQRWQLKLGGDQSDYQGGPYATVADGRLYVQTRLGPEGYSLSAFDAATGDPLWDYALNGTLDVRPVVVDGLLVAEQARFENSERLTQLFALDAATGEPRWSYDLSSNGPQDRLEAGDGRLYYFTFDGTAVALEAATGQQLWATPLGDTDPNDPHIEPAYADGRLFVATGGGTVSALDAATGAELWTYPVGDALKANLTTGSGQVFIGTLEGWLRVVDAPTGALTWEVRQPLRKAFPDMEYYPPIDTAPLVADGVVYFTLGESLVAAQAVP